MFLLSRATTYCFSFAWSKCIKYNSVTQKPYSIWCERDTVETEVALHALHVTKLGPTIVTLVDTLLKL